MYEIKRDEWYNIFFGNNFILMYGDIKGVLLILILCVF